MLMVSDRTKKIAFSLAYVAVIVLAASAGFAEEGGEGLTMPITPQPR